MGKRGNRPLHKNEDIIDVEKLNCLRCNGEFASNMFYSSDSEIYGSIGKIPYCRECLDKFYQSYLKNYKLSGYINPERKAIERICMMLDIYYSDKIYDSAIKLSETKTEATIFALYLKQAKLYQYRKKNYDSTISDRYRELKDENAVTFLDNKYIEEQNKDIQTAIKLFGNGFDTDDYIYLYEQYTDWTTRHECETKAQEEIFKQICFTQLELLKAARAKQDTKDLTATFQKLLDTAKLQPKQNSGDTTANTQTFGTLIDKWENTRPLPEIDEDLQDVDKIAQYINVFFKGHLAKMMGLKNGLSNAYTKYMKKYTVERPEYNDDEDGEALFDAIFGNVDVEDI